MKLNYVAKVLAIGCLLPACGGGGGGGGGGGVTPTIRSIAISGAPGTLTPGQTANLTATATFSDNSTQNVTSSAVWQSSAGGVATVSGGVVTAVSAGSTNITAATQGVTSAVAVITVSGGGGTGTFTLTGTITEQNTTTPIPAVDIEIIDGPNGGRTTTSTAQGVYTFTQLSTGTLTLRARHALYDRTDSAVTLTGNQTHNFQMIRTAAPVTITAIIDLPSGVQEIRHNIDTTIFGDRSSSSAGRIVRWTWNCGQSVASNCTPDGGFPTPVFNYRKCGSNLPDRPPCTSGDTATYTIRLTVTDERGNTGSTTRSVTVRNSYN